MNSRVIVVGAGLTGSVLMESMISTIHAHELGWEIIIVDYDTLEFRNCIGNHNVHTGVGVMKASLLATRLLDNGIVASAITQKLTPKNVANIISGADLVIGAVDNITARRTIWDGCVAANVPYMDIGLNTNTFIVSWTYGDVDTMPYSPKFYNGEELQKADKIPPCELIATRRQAALAVELAMLSAAIFLAGIDPTRVVDVGLNRKAKNGDIVGWHGASATTQYSAQAVFPGVVE